MELPRFGLVDDHLLPRALGCGVGLLAPGAQNDVDVVGRGQLAQCPDQAKGEVPLHTNTAAGAGPNDVHRQALLGPRVNAFVIVDSCELCLRLADERSNRRCECFKVRAAGGLADVAEPDVRCLV